MTPRGPHQVSKKPQDDLGKLGRNSNFSSGHRNFTARIKYFKFKIESKVSLLSCIPSLSQKKKEDRFVLYFIVFPKSYLVESGFSRVTYLLPTSA
jgi:hypothetical protein